MITNENKDVLAEILAETLAEARIVSNKYRTLRDRAQWLQDEIFSRDTGIRKGVKVLVNGQLGEVMYSGAGHSLFENRIHAGVSFYNKRGVLKKRTEYFEGEEEIQKIIIMKGHKQ
jgi:hypothetical protein